MHKLFWAFIVYTNNGKQSFRLRINAEIDSCMLYVYIHIGKGIITIVIVSITTTYLTIDNLMSVDKDDIVGKQGNSFKT